MSHQISRLHTKLQSDWKKASCSREAATAFTSKKTIKPSKAARAVQEQADHLSLKTFKEEMTRYMNDWKAEKQREIKELQAEKKSPSAKQPAEAK